MKFGCSIDIQCATLALGYENHCYKKQNNGGNVQTEHSQDELQSMLDAVKGHKNGNIQE